MKRILKNISTSAFALFAMLALSCTDDDFYPVETHRSDSTVRTSGDYSVTEKEAVDKAREALASFVNAGSTAKGLSRQSAREDQRPVVTSRSRHATSISLISMEEDLPWCRQTTAPLIYTRCRPPERLMRMQVTVWSIS